MLLLMVAFRDFDLQTFLLQKDAQVFYTGRKLPFLLRRGGAEEITKELKELLLLRSLSCQLHLVGVVLSGRNILH
jgi:hypothetical protein